MRDLHVAISTKRENTMLIYSDRKETDRFCDGERKMEIPASSKCLQKVGFPAIPRSRLTITHIFQPWYRYQKIRCDQVQCHIHVIECRDKWRLKSQLVEPESHAYRVKFLSLLKLPWFLFFVILWQKKTRSAFACDRRQALTPSDTKGSWNYPDWQISSS
jgi:hypothetical protein